MYSYDVEAAKRRKRHFELLYNRTGHEVWGTGLCLARACPAFFVCWLRWTALSGAAEEFDVKKRYEPVAAELSKARAATGCVPACSRLGEGLHVHGSRAKTLVNAVDQGVAGSLLRCAGQRL